MSLAEVIVILTISLIVFGPKKLPTLAQHLGLLVGKFKRWQEQFHQLWQTKIKEIELLENQKKAAETDALYQRTEKPQEK